MSLVSLDGSRNPLLPSQIPGQNPAGCSGSQQCRKEFGAPRVRNSSVWDAISRGERLDPRGLKSKCVGSQQ